MKCVCSQIVAFAWMMVWLMASTSTALEITDVVAQPQAFDPVDGERARIAFRLSESARVRVHIYDARDVCIRELESGELLPAGVHELFWNGRDSLERPVLPEVYRYAIEAGSFDVGSSSVIWDLSDVTKLDRIAISDARWDPQAKKILYQLAEPARVRIRVGVADGGPLLATVIDWVPRAAGVHAERWDGFDRSGVLDLSQHPKLALSVEAFGLSQNHLRVGGAPARSEVIADLPSVHDRPRRDDRSPRMLDYPAQRAEDRRDFPVELSMPGVSTWTEDGVPIVSSTVSVEVGLADEDLSRLLGERFEVVYFVDGTFLFENEVGFLPLTWKWDPAGLPSGRHYLSINVRGYDGHFGIATQPVEVSNP